MSMVFNKISKKNPQTKEVKFYPMIKLIGRKTEKDLAERLARNTTLSPGEARLAVEEMRQAVLDFLLDGYSVEISDWASFRPTFTAEGADTLEACTAALVKKVYCRVQVSKEFSDALQKAKFVPAGDLHTTDKN